MIVTEFSMLEAMEKMYPLEFAAKDETWSPPSPYSAIMAKTSSPQPSALWFYLQPLKTSHPLPELIPPVV